jgi:hypothetical protein
MGKGVDGGREWHCVAGSRGEGRGLRAGMASRCRIRWGKGVDAGREWRGRRWGSALRGAVGKDGGMVKPTVDAHSRYIYRVIGWLANHNQVCRMR